MSAQNVKRFLAGFGSVIELLPAGKRRTSISKIKAYEIAGKSLSESLHADWENVGIDLTSVISRAKRREFQQPTKIQDRVPTN